MNNTFLEVEKKIKSQNFKIVDYDLNRPWGGFYVISEDDAQDFSNIYFNGLNTEELKISGKLSPKILIITPNKRLSWQYHHRRSEICKVVSGEIKVVTSNDDVERKNVPFFDYPGRLDPVLYIEKGTYYRAIRDGGALTTDMDGFTRETGTGTSRGDLWGYSPRMTGIRIYWSKQGDTRGEKWLLYEIDCKKGIRRGDSDPSMGNDVWYTMKPSYYAYTNTYGDETSAPNVSFDNVIWLHSQDQTDDFELFEFPPKLYTYEQLSGLKYDEENICVQSFGAGVIANRRAYVGNVKILDEQNAGEDHADNEDNNIYEDLILKSLPNKFDTFPFKYGKLEVAINDGEKIIHLAEYNDRLLVFKESTLYIVNISQDIEFLEATYAYKGVKSPSSVAKTDIGFAWVNTFGAYIFDGEKVIDILQSKQGARYITEDMWTSCINEHDYPGVAFNPEDKKLTIVNNLGPHTANSHGANTAQFIFDMKLNNWTTFTKFDAISGTNESFVIPG